MPNDIKQKESELSVNKSKRIIVKVKDNSIRIAIPGKTFNQIRDRVERAVYSTKKSEMKKAIYKGLRGHGILIRIFLQNELNAYYEEYANQKGLDTKGTYPYITNYREQEGSLELFYDITVTLAAQTLFIMIEPMVKDVANGFNQWVKKKLEECLHSKDEEKRPTIAVEDGGISKPKESKK